MSGVGAAKMESVYVENDPNVNLEAFSDRPSKGNAGETVMLSVCHRSTSNV